MDNRIWQELDFFLIGGQRIDMDPSVVQLPEEQVALVWQYQFDDVSGLMGHVDNIRLEGSEIFCDLHITKDGVEDQLEALKDEVRLGGYYNNVVKDEAGTQVLECTLRAVSIVFNSGMPGVNPGAKI